MFIKFMKMSDQSTTLFLLMHKAFILCKGSILYSLYLWQHLQILIKILSILTETIWYLQKSL